MKHFQMEKNIGEIKRKVFFGFIELHVLLGIAIFLPAWSLNFWQAWLFLFVFSICVLAITIYFLKKDPKLIEGRLKAGPTAEKVKSPKIIQIFASLFFIMLPVVSGFDHHFRWSNVPIYLIIVGDAFIVLGYMIIFFVFKENSYASGIIEVEKEQKAISTGPYGAIRHPMYAGALLMLSFIPIALGSFWALIFVFPMFAIIIFRLLNEEKLLSKELLGYKEYCQTTRYRLIPYVW
jgi:protein-S-isoprenylcysteine O-methyltransferase Ste14